MNKRQFIAPYVMLGATGGDSGVIGGKTGQGGTHVPDALLTYQQWIDSDFYDDWYEGNGINIDDYVYWGAESGYTWEELAAANSGIEWKPIYADWFNGN